MQRRPIPSRWLTVLFVALMALTLALPGAAQERRLEGEVLGEGYSSIKIAVPGVREGGDVAAEIVQTVRDDLEFSGIFDVVDTSLYRLVLEAEGSEERFEDWISIGADALVRVTLGPNRDRIDMQARLYDNLSGTLLFARRYGGRNELARLVAHQLADDLVRHYTGAPGVAMTRIAFSSRHGEGKEIYLMDYDGQRLRRLTTTDTINITPVWSPKGDELAYVSWRGRQPGVFVMSSEGVLGHLATVGGELSAAPDWSPDGRKLVYSAFVEDNSELYILDRNTGRNTRLTHNPAIDTAPAYSPNGREIAFTSDRSGGPQIYVMSAEGLNTRRISWSGSYNDSAAWSPSGDRMAYVSRIEGRFELMLLDLTSDRTRRLTWGEGNNENPRWSPDGRHIVFASDRAGTYDIYTIRADGSDVRRLTRGGNCYTPDWSKTD
jgi:TolB protein